MIEIKYTSGRNISAFKDIVKEYGYEDIVTAACMYHDTLDSLESDFPDMPKLYLCQDQAGINVACGLSNIDIVCADKSVMTESNCKLVHDSGKKFSARTLDTEEEIKSAINIGVDSYITNEAETAMKLE